MAITSGKTKACDAYRRMEKVRQFFSIGERFWYSPVVSPDSEVFVEVRPCDEMSEHYDDCFGSDECEKFCALHRWCSVAGNTVNVNGLNVNYIPECGDDKREDKTSVYFKEIIS